MKPIYDSRDPDCKRPFGALRTGQTATFTVHLPKTLPGSRVELVVYQMDRWDQPLCTVFMELCEAGMLQNSYRCTFSHDEPALLCYHFRLTSGENRRELRRGQDGRGVIGDGGLWQLTVYDAAMRAPACLSGGVMYQIFPDRFCCSGKEKQNVPADRTLRTDWGGMPVWRPNEQGEVTNSDYFQGDLAGITEKLGYLQSLGVTALYLNPIFEAHSNHRYNTADYKKIDPLLGDESDFQTLCQEAARRGIVVILDGVFSHTGSDSIYFNREKRYGDGGAYNDQKSPWSSWYRFSRWPDSYESWWGFPTLPNVEEVDPDYLEFICGEDGVLRHWLRQGAAGFRLDVADELPDLFLDRLRACVKSENPNAAVIGEVWEDASNKTSYGVRRRYLLGGQLDSVMNYPFKDALLQYVRSGGGSAFLQSILQILENYPQPVIRALMNSLSTHDTARAITVLAGEPLGEHDRTWQEAHQYLSAEQYSHGRRLFILASILQFGLPGIPCVYYGDEAGLTGYKDPFNRICYPWGRENQETLEAVRALGSVRIHYPILADADFLPVQFDDNVCAFTRHKDGWNLLFAINRTDRKQPLLIPDFGRQREVLFCHGSWQGGHLGAFSGVVISWQN